MSAAAALSVAAIGCLAIGHRPRRGRLLTPAPGSMPPTPSLARALGRAVRHRRGNEPDAAVDHRLGAALLWALVMAPIEPLAAPIVGLVRWYGPIVRLRSTRRRRDRAVWANLPEVVDLLALAAGAGLAPGAALVAVAPRCTGPVGDALRRGAARWSAGESFVDACAAVGADIGPAAEGAVRALVAGHRHGGPVADALVGVAQSLRHDRRRRAEETARRVPVLLLFPLVTCILPAFILLTVVPLVAGSWSSLAAG